MENRREILCSYYDLNPEVVDKLARTPRGPERNQLCQLYGVNPYVLRTMVDYSRYFEASMVVEQLRKRSVSFDQLRMIDFGCLVADYGISFGRLGSSVVLYDIKSHTDFALFRFRQEGLDAQVRLVPTPLQVLFKDVQLAVFGEVLEHIDDPLQVLKTCVERGVSYVFTSCYPFGDEPYFALPGHSRSAQKLQGQCLDMLQANYAGVNTHKKAWFWTNRSLAQSPVG